MFVGHFALGFGAKKVAPMVSLGTLFLAAQFADVLWPTLLMPRATRARTKAATYFAALSGPPPPSPNVLMRSAQSMWLLVAWGYWLDRQRINQKLVSRP
jgi:hypothetical protein